MTLVLLALVVAFVVAVPSGVDLASDHSAGLRLSNQVVPRGVPIADRPVSLDADLHSLRATEGRPTHPGLDRR